MTTFPISPPATTAAATCTAVHDNSPTTYFSTLHPDIIESHILTRLDGPTLASASCSSTTLHHLSSQDHLWSQVCRARWPSIATPRVTEIISAFPNGGPRGFFAQSFLLPLLDSSLTASSASLPTELISAVDIHYMDELIFSKIQETETITGWFRSSPFRIDLLEPKDAVPTPIKHPERDNTWLKLIGDMTLSWILIDPIGRRSMNLSSHKPVSVQRHWLSGEVQARYSWILTAEDADRKGHVQCGIVVTCGRSEGGEMHVREVSMEMEDIDGMRLNGKDTLAILERALEGKKGIARNKEVEGQRRYKEFVERKKERKEKKVRREGAIDILCVGFGICIFAGFWGLVWRFC